MVIIGRLVLIGMFILAFYLPLRGWSSWRGKWRYVALLPILPLLGLMAYVMGFVFLHQPEQVLSPEWMVLVILGSLVSSAVLGLIYNKSQA